MLVTEEKDREEEFKVELVRTPVVWELRRRGWYPHT